MIVHEWSAGTGSPREEGRRFGRAWARQLAAAHDDYAALFAAVGVPTSTADEVADGCWEATVEHTPTIADELAGMADGSGLTRRQVMTLAARTEILGWATAAEECSTVVHLPDDGSPPRTLQTWDWHDTLSNEAVVRRVRTADGEWTGTFCEFGQPAKIGVSSRGLGVHFNILNHDSDGTTTGVPVHVLSRRILDEASTVAEAVAIARATPLAASSVLTVVAHDRSEGATAAAIEVAPAGTAVVPVSRGEVFAHTNHFLDRGLAAGGVIRATSTTHERLTCVTEAADLAQIADARSRAEAFGAIPEAPISVRPRRDVPAHLRTETKLTIALDVARARLEFASGAPADVAGARWRAVDARAA